VVTIAEKHEKTLTSGPLALNWLHIYLELSPHSFYRVDHTNFGFQPEIVTSTSTSDNLTFVKEPFDWDNEGCAGQLEGFPTKPMFAKLLPAFKLKEKQPKPKRPVLVGKLLLTSFP
jgi:hypothetical protein